MNHFETEINYKGIFFTSNNYFLTDLLRPPWSAAAPFSKTVLTKMGMSPWGEPKPPTIEKPRLCWPLHNTLSEIESFVFSKVTELPQFTVTRDSFTQWRFIKIEKPSWPLHKTLSDIESCCLFKGDGFTRCVWKQMRRATLLKNGTN
jgi:hypothetical protein